ncbi:MAG: hypothetical protein WAT39_24995 [Planctomycetota bacterium]
MNEVSLRPWRKITDRDLQRWAGGQLLARAQAVVRAGRVRDLVRTAAGEVFATVIGGAAGEVRGGGNVNGDPSGRCVGDASVTPRAHFGGVVMEFERRLRFHSLCTCERVPCAHAVAVAITVRDAVVARRTPPLMARTDRRCAELPRSEARETRVSFLAEDRDDSSWLPDDASDRTDPGGA